MNIEYKGFNRRVHKRSYMAYAYNAYYDSKTYYLNGMTRSISDNFLNHIKR